MGHSCRKSTTANQIMSLPSNKMKIVPLLLLIAPAALAAPMSAEDSGEEDFDNLILSRAGEFGDSGEDFEDFDNLTLSRAAEFEERAINTCDCAPVSSSDRIVGGKEVNPKYKLPYQVLVSPCASNGGFLFNCCYNCCYNWCYNRPACYDNWRTSFHDWTRLWQLWQLRQLWKLQL